jgi:anti-anti-sigma factor
MTGTESKHLFEWQDAGGVAVVHFKTTHLRDELQIRAIFDQLEQLVAAGQTKVVLNFAGMEVLASYAIGKLIRFNDRVQQAGGRLALCELTPTVEEILDIMSLRRRFAIYATEREALESFV